MSVEQLLDPATRLKLQRGCLKSCLSLTKAVLRASFPYLSLSLSFLFKGTYRELVGEVALLLPIRAVFRAIFAYLLYLSYHFSFF